MISYINSTNFDEFMYIFIKFWINHAWIYKIWKSIRRGFHSTRVVDTWKIFAAKNCDWFLVSFVVFVNCEFLSQLIVIRLPHQHFFNNLFRCPWLWQDVGHDPFVLKSIKMTSRGGSQKKKEHEILIELCSGNADVWGCRYDKIENLI